MTESWQIALMTGVLTVMTAILGWIAMTLTGLRKDLNKKVDKYDCEHGMDRHCQRLDALDKDVKANSYDIAELKARLK